MGKGYKITLGILTILILLTITVGTSYSYYSVGDVQTEANVLNTTCFSITYNDTASTLINMTNAKPSSDATGLASTPYTFTITNTCGAGNANTKYVVTLNTLTSPATTLPTSYLRYSFGKGSGVAGTAAAFPTTEYALNPNVKTKYSVAKSYQLATGELAPGASETFNLRLWLSDVEVNCTVDASGNSTCTPDIMGKSFAGKILVYNYM